MVTWGLDWSGGDSSKVAARLDGRVDVSQIFSTERAFAALRADGSVVTWGGWGGDSGRVAAELDGRVAVSQIFSTGSAFAALRADGSVVTWGYGDSGGDSSKVAAKLDGRVDVSQIFSTGSSFAALRADGSVVTWGSEWAGGDSSKVAFDLTAHIASGADIYTDDVFQSANQAPTGGVTIAGRPLLGQTLTAHNTLADADGLGTIRYTWTADGAVVGRGRRYAPKAADVGKAIKVSAGYTDSAGIHEQVSSAAVRVGETKTGTAAADTLTGTAGDDWLQGLGGDDHLQGLGGDDVLDGGDGNDVLDGGAGDDIMTGGLGDDVYQVASVGDVVIENGGEGRDWIMATVSISALSAHVEHLHLLGAALDGVGNELANVLVGNRAANVLTGGAGNDWLRGGFGNDTLTGGDGRDLLAGHAGNDTLTGGGGRDIFIFNTALSASNIDTLTDFTLGADRIQLSHAVFTRLTAIGALDPAHLRIGTAAADADDHLVYNRTTGALFYDADGNGSGAAVQVAVLGGNPALTAADFMVI